jgi:hypothetical protein
MKLHAFFAVCNPNSYEKRGFEETGGGLIQMEHFHLMTHPIVIQQPHSYSDISISSFSLFLFFPNLFFSHALSLFNSS